MINSIKKILKTLLIIVLLLLIGIMSYRYQKLKEEGRLDEILASSKKDTVYINSTDPYKTSDASKNDSSEDDSNKNESSEGEFVLEKKNYDGYYNEFNFDNVLLMYEGDQNGKTTKEALERLIVDADDSLYTKPTVIFQNFNGLSKNEISAENLEEYKNVLNEAKNSIKNEIYNFTFEYSKFNAIVDTIIITKK